MHGLNTPLLDQEVVYYPINHHYININSQTKNGQGIVSVIIYGMYMQLMCQKYYIFQICDLLLIGPRGSILPQHLLKTAYSQNF